MKKFLIGLTVFTLLALGASVYAYGPGWFGGGYTCQGNGYGSMIGPGHWRGWSGEDSQRFLDKTADLRKELHNKRFEYSEAVRNPKTSPETIAQLEKEIRDINEKIYADTPQRVNGRPYRYGCMW